MKRVKPDKKKWLKREGYSKKILLSEKDIKPGGHLVQIVGSKPHTKVDLHYHKETTEIYHILKGNATLILDKKEFQTEPGDTFLSEPGEIHGIINNTEKDFVILVLKINRKKNDTYWV
ncbi:MAG: cupin domain-containing protein, partial [Thermoproteota archaeon]